jgi:tetratricopeptide (TPR) repeat protein
MEMYGMNGLNGNGPLSLEAQMLYRQALEMVNQGRYDAALSTLKKVVMIAPRFTRAFDEMGNCLNRLGRYPEALATYNKVLAIEPTYEGVLLKRDIILKRIGSSPAWKQNFTEKTQGKTRNEGKAQDHSLMDDLAMIARIPHQENYSSAGFQYTGLSAQSHHQQFIQVHH